MHGVGSLLSTDVRFPVCTMLWPYSITSNVGQFHLLFIVRVPFPVGDQTLPYETDMKRIIGLKNSWYRYPIVYCRRSSNLPLTIIGHRALVGSVALFDP